MTEDMLIEPEEDIESEDIESGIARDIEESLVTLVPLAEILPADFRLSPLVQFVPNIALRQAAESAAEYALRIVVSGADGLKQADLAAAVLRERQQSIESHFLEPIAIAHSLHKRLTTIRGEWLEAGARALKTLGGRMFTEQQRLEDIATAAKRAAQVEADKHVREDAAKAAERAAAARAPLEIVEELRREAATATAPPVMVPDLEPPILRSSSTVTTWKARLVGTSADAEPNPEVVALTPAQRLQVFALLRDILDGKAPLGAIELNWKYLNARAKADRKTMSIAGVEPYQDTGLRAKSGRR